MSEKPVITYHVDATGKHVMGRVTIGGQDISNRVQGLSLDHDARTGQLTMILRIVSLPGDDIEAIVPTDKVALHETRYIEVGAKREPASVA